MTFVFEDGVLALREKPGQARGGHDTVAGDVVSTF
jgi:hypothetical protein